MELVSFISIEDDPPDLILSFAIWQQELEDIRSLILMRTPKYEFIFDETERGVKVSEESWLDEVDDMLKEIEFGIGNSLILADERDAGGDIGSNFNMFEAGLDIRHPLGMSFLGHGLDTSFYFVVSRFFNNYELGEPDGDSTKIKTLFEIGLTIGIDEPIDIWKVSLGCIGVDFRFGDHFSGIGLNMGFPF